jgi:hypothetical protein
MTALTDRAAEVPISGLGKPQADPRDPEQYRADLEQETEASLRRDASRWPWRSSGEVRDVHRGRLPRG